MNRAERGPRRTRRAGAVIVGGFLVATTACADDQPASAPLLFTVPDTVELGEFPEPPSEEREAPLPSTTLVNATSTSAAAPTPVQISVPVGDAVEGNRVIFIGDTVIASTAPRFDGAMCDALEAFGWQAEIAAEVGRFVEFGSTVVEARVRPEEPEWDVVGVMLGNHFDGDAAKYAAELDALVASLSPRPMLVYTLVEDDTFQAPLNEIIRDLPNRYPNVLIVDWAEIVAEEPDVLTSDTPSGLSEEGRTRLALFTVAALGDPPVIDGAGCVPPVFVDDSAIVL